MPEPTLKLMQLFDGGVEALSQVWGWGWGCECANVRKKVVKIADARRDREIRI